MTLKLKPCPWCGADPCFISFVDETEVHCINRLCRARPIISIGKKYTKQQVVVVWNSYDDMTNEKNKIKDLKKFKENYSKKDLQQILYDVMCSEEIWNKYLPDVEYMTLK